MIDLTDEDPHSGQNPQKNNSNIYLVGIVRWFYHLTIPIISQFQNDSKNQLNKPHVDGTLTDACAF
jgi:hypothetical protein